MDLPDRILTSNRDWDPNYLMDIMSEDFYDFGDLWGSTVNDRELVRDVEKLEKYCPVVEDISMDDETLCSAVEKIEEE